MSSEKRDIAQAVSSKPLQEACRYILYELRRGMSTSLTSIRLLHQLDLDQTRRSELLRLAESGIVEAMEAVDDLFVDILMKRLEEIGND